MTVWQELKGEIRWMQDIVKRYGRDISAMKEFLDGMERNGVVFMANNESDDRQITKFGNSECVAQKEKEEVNP